MDQTLLGERLIFMISQPRSGSTMLQRMLGCHPDVHTVSEPWLMLHPFYACRDGYQADYDADTARTALNHFVQGIKRSGGSQDVYLQGVRRMYSYLYDCALSGSNKKYFLDKTPRYYLIIPQILKTFPKAKFIILIRNPLAVLTSILKTWKKENWFSIQQHSHDLMRAPELILDGINQLGPKAAVVHYEQLTRDPARVLQGVCQHLQLEFHPQMVDYGRHGQAAWPLGDPQTVYQHSRPAAHYADRWLTSIQDPQVWRLAKDYLGALGPTLIHRLGYSYADLERSLGANQPGRTKFTVSLSWLLAKLATQRTGIEHARLRLLRSLQTQGTGATAVKVVKQSCQIPFRPIKHAINKLLIPKIPYDSNI